MKMEQTECSEMLAYKIQTPGNYPEENIQHDLTYPLAPYKKYVTGHQPPPIGHTGVFTFLNGRGPVRGRFRILDPTGSSEFLPPSSPSKAVIGQLSSNLLQ
jgi:hypothetical protein